MVDSIDVLQILESLVIFGLLYSIYLFVLLISLLIIDGDDKTNLHNYIINKKEEHNNEKDIDNNLIVESTIRDMVDVIVDTCNTRDNIHIMNLDSNWFLHVKSGKKNIECRVYDDKRKQLNIGDKIIFKNNSSEDKVEKNIKKLQLFSDFETALKCGKLKNILPGVKSYRDGLNIYNEIPGYVDKSKDNGVLLIYLE